MKQEIFVVFPVTLFESVPRIAQDKHTLVVEHPVYFGFIGDKTYDFSKPKLAYTKACVLAYCDHLADSDVDFTHCSVEDYEQYRSKFKSCHLTFFDPVDKIVVDDLRLAAGSLTILEAPNYLTSEADMQRYIDNKPSDNYFHKHFYEWQRKRTGHPYDRRKACRWQILF